MATEHFSGDQTGTSADCPRCGSTNTKFCYFNNYNKSQPRHFCKSCKRHWTKGGALRNVPAGRRRRNKRHHRPSATPAPPRPQEHFRNPFSLSTHLQNDMSDILYQALARSSTAECIDKVVPQCAILESHGTTYMPRNQDAEFTFSTTFNYQSSGETTEESTVTTSAVPPPPATVNPGSLWNWNSEIDYLGSSADTYALWDDFDADFKPFFGG